MSAIFSMAPLPTVSWNPTTHCPAESLSDGRISRLKAIEVELIQRRPAAVLLAFRARQTLAKSRTTISIAQQTQAQLLLHLDDREQDDADSDDQQAIEERYRVRAEDVLERR